MKLDTLKWHIEKVAGEADRYMLLLVNEKESMGVRMEFTHKALTKLCRSGLKYLSKQPQAKV
jgi:hypothetical protein